MQKPPGQRAGGAAAPVPVSVRADSSCFTPPQGYGYTPVGEANRSIHLHTEIPLTDDKLGTITRVASGIDDYTGTEVVHSEKTWTYPVS